MFDTICTLPLSSDLFAQTLHPTAPLLAVGLSAGHVATLRLPSVPGSDEGTNNGAVDKSVNGYGQIETAWRTRRHKGSCRCLGYSTDGDTLFSAGTDGIVKAASSETGRVTAKINLPLDPSAGGIDSPSLLHTLSPQTLLVATDSSALHLYDLRAPSSEFASRKPAQTHHPHDSYISSLTPLPPSATSTSGFSKQWLSTGGSTLALTDLRRGVLVKSEDQEEELLSSVYVTGLPARGGHGSEKAIVGGAGGVLTLWEKGAWDDQDERIVVDRGNKAGSATGESLDVLTMVPEGVGASGKHVVVGLGDGRISFVKLGPNKVVAELRHDELEGVMALDFDVGGRMVSGGGAVVKVWHEKIENEDAEKETDTVQSLDGAKRVAESDDDSDDKDEDSSEEEEKERKRRKKRKRNKGKDRSGGKLMSFSGLD
ncbi:WD repeat-containing protein jip5 [Elasticomyces elasticus]|nr:WD repeat-containing protein jip5 [Elasticomyces elasticus]